MSKDITEYTSEELFKMAKEKQEQEYLSRRPNIVGSAPELIDLAKSYMDSEEQLCEVDTQYAYEAVMEYVYGKGVWCYINGLGE